VSFSHTWEAEDRSFSKSYDFIFGGTWMQRVIKFFRNVSIEMQKVSWPRRKELYRYTLTVVSTVIFFILFFTLVDLGITFLIELTP